MEQQRTFGAYLQTERELRQIPLSEVSAATKIPLRVLQSLEQGFWENLPADVFVRGFVRSYAKHVGMPPEEACLCYNHTLSTIHKEQTKLITRAVGDDAAETAGRRRFGLALFVIIILIIATITLSLFWRRGASAEPHAFLLQETVERA